MMLIQSNFRSFKVEVILFSLIKYRQYNHLSLNQINKPVKSVLMNSITSPQLNNAITNFDKNVFPYIYTIQQYLAKCKRSLGHSLAVLQF
ncbi:unnamed protein product [Paramecium octaurelia]|uniref:Uncharacterized protein n=1 Tax=Paramecium octaurelia TaxID=43137 RepID=A0A8S1RZR3_PAROT|nr:unnamed protein product [Paramecium octaurelia]